jgi:hypothetical protein
MSDNPVFLQEAPAPKPKRGRPTPHVDPFVEHLRANPNEWFKYPQKVSALPTGLKKASDQDPTLDFELRRDEENRTISRYFVYGRCDPAGA